MWVYLMVLCVLVTGCVDDSSECHNDSDCKGQRVCNYGWCQDPLVKKHCGDVIVVCGCYGLSNGQIVGALGCESGQAQAEGCTAACGVATLNRCYCAQRTGFRVD